MTLKTYSVKLADSKGAQRDVIVPSPTDVQAGDAARPLMRDDEVILAIAQVTDPAALDAEPPKTQAEELAPATPGMAATPQPSPIRETDHG